MLARKQEKPLAAPLLFFLKADIDSSEIHLILPVYCLESS